MGDLGLVMAEQRRRPLQQLNGVLMALTWTTKLIQALIQENQIFNRMFFQHKI